MQDGIFAGSFNPIHNGHVECIRRALDLVDNLHVIVAVNPDKMPTQDVRDEVDSRVRLVSEVVEHEFTHAEKKRIHLGTSHKALLVKLAARLGVQVLIRGVRNAADFAYEQNMANINEMLDPYAQTVFLPTSKKYAEVSSSAIRHMIQYEGGESVVKNWVPASVLEHLMKKRGF